MDREFKECERIHSSSEGGRMAIENRPLDVHHLPDIFMSDESEWGEGVKDIPRPAAYQEDEPTQKGDAEGEERGEKQKEVGGITDDEMEVRLGIDGNFQEEGYRIPIQPKHSSSYSNEADVKKASGRESPQQASRSLGRLPILSTLTKTP